MVYFLLMNASLFSCVSVAVVRLLFSGSWEMGKTELWDDTKRVVIFCGLHTNYTVFCGDSQTNQCNRFRFPIVLIHQWITCAIPGTFHGFVLVCCVFSASLRRLYPLKSLVFVGFSMFPASSLPIFSIIGSVDYVTILRSGGCSQSQRFQAGSLHPFPICELPQILFLPIIARHYSPDRWAIKKHLSQRTHLETNGRARGGEGSALRWSLVSCGHRDSL